MIDQILTLKEVAAYLKLAEKTLTGLLVRASYLDLRLVAHGALNEKNLKRGLIAKRPTENTKEMLCYQARYLGGSSLKHLLEFNEN